MNAGQLRSVSLNGIDDFRLIDFQLAEHFLVGRDQLGFDDHVARQQARLGGGASLDHAVDPVEHPIGDPKAATSTGLSDDLGRRRTRSARAAASARRRASSTLPLDGQVRPSSRAAGSVARAASSDRPPACRRPCGSGRRRRIPAAAAGESAWTAVIAPIFITSPRLRMGLGGHRDRQPLRLFRRLAARRLRTAARPSRDLPVRLPRQFGVDLRHSLSMGRRRSARSCRRCGTPAWPGRPPSREARR